MKKILLILICGALAAIDKCYDQTGVTRQLPTSIKLKQVHTSEALVELGRTTQVNLMADVTQFPRDVAPISLNSTGSLQQHLAELDAKQKLTWLPYRRTLLLWNAPDLRQLAQSIVEGDTIKLVMPESTSPATDEKTDGLTPPTTTPKLSKEELLFKEVSAYFRDTHAWDSTKPGSVSEIRISQLPPALRLKVVAAVQAELLNQTSATIWKSWFTDDFWNNAQLKLVEETNGNPNGPKIPVLTVGASMRIGSGSGGSMMSLGALEGLPHN